MKWFDGWNTHRFASDWRCTRCGRMHYAAAVAWYFKLTDGPYCLRCMIEATETASENEPVKVLQQNP